MICNHVSNKLVQEELPTTIQQSVCISEVRTLFWKLLNTHSTCATHVQWGTNYDCKQACLGMSLRRRPDGSTCCLKGMNKGHQHTMYKHFSRSSESFDYITVCRWKNPQIPFNCLQILVWNCFSAVFHKWWTSPHLSCECLRISKTHLLYSIISTVTNQHVYI